MDICCLMKVIHLKYLRVFFWLILAIVFSSCKDKEKTTTLKIRVSNTFENQEIVADAQMKYKNNLNQFIGIQGFRYFISGMYALTTTGDRIQLGGYHLIDQKNPTSLNFQHVVSGLAEITKIGFMLGIDTSENRTASLRQTIDPDNLMYWPWLGYRFFVLDGSFKSDTINGGFTFHLGTDICRLEYELPVQFPLGSEEIVSLKLGCALDELFKNPNVINLVQDNYTHSDPGIPAEVLLSAKLAQNLKDAFSLVKE